MDNSQIEFLLDGQCFFDEQAANHASLGAGLMRHQSHPKNFGGQFDSFPYRLRDLHAPALATSPGMDLGFDHNSTRTCVKQSLCSGFRLLAGFSHFATRHRNTILFRIDLA